LKINKDIIEGFCNHGNNKDKNDYYVIKLKEENEKMTTQLDKITKEKEEIRQKVINPNPARIC
jgi:hypothetical protein